MEIEKVIKATSAQGSKIVHIKVEPCDIRIDRQTIWGNPHYLADTTSHPARVKCLLAYVATMERSPKLVEKTSELRGKSLGCWCAPRMCHGDVLATLASVDTLEEKNQILLCWRKYLEELL